MLFVSFHGGKPSKDNPTPVNNIFAYDKDGNRVTKTVLQGADNLLEELRGILLQNSLFYVASGSKKQDSLLCFQGSGTEYSYVSALASNATVNSILHPFGFTFDSQSHCYVSSQDTNVVTRLVVATGGKTATAAPLAPALPAGGTFLDGTFVASSNGSLPGVPATTPVSPPAGLEVSFSEGGAKVQHSVRDVVWVNGALYVADEPGNAVKVYDANGNYLGESNKVDGPVHLLVYSGTLYVSSGDQVFTSPLNASQPGQLTLQPIPSVQVKDLSGMAFSNSGEFYAASRTKNEIWKYDSSFGSPAKFAKNLPDNPEFLLHV